MNMTTCLHVYCIIVYSTLQIPLNPENDSNHEVFDDNISLYFSM